MESRRSPILAGLFFCTAVLAGSQALAAGDQDSSQWKYTWEVFGSAGRAGFYHGDHHLGSGLDLGGGIGVRPFSGALGGLGFEACFNNFNFHKSWGDGYSQEGATRALTGNALYHFGKSRAQFYCLGGLGLFRADYTLVNGYMKNVLKLPNYEEQIKAHKMVLDLGVGVKVRVTSRISVRPEVRWLDTTIGSGYNWSHLRFSVGVGYHF